MSDSNVFYFGRGRQRVRKSGLISLHAFHLLRESGVRVLLEHCVIHLHKICIPLYRFCHGQIAEESPRVSYALQVGAGRSGNVLVHGLSQLFLPSWNRVVYAAKRPTNSLFNIPSCWAHREACTSIKSSTYYILGLGQPYR